MITKESTSVGTPEPGLVRVQHVQIDDGMDMGGELWFSKDNLQWLLDKLSECVNTYGFPRTEESRGDDHFRVFEGGHEQAPFVHVLNRRTEGTDHSGLSGIQVSKSVAQDLIDQLKAL